MLTIANLICGSLAIISILTTSQYDHAFMLIVLAGVFDFLDGFAARLLGQSSPIGVQLDSLSDMVSFGLAPALIMMTLFERCTAEWQSPVWGAYGGYLALLILAFSALRLAKFNIDEEQSTTFIGLPTPACALFCASVGLLYDKGYPLTAEYVAAISVVMAGLLLLPIRMFSLKFHGFQWRGNVVRYLFLLAALILLILLQTGAMAIIILLYVAISITQSIAGRNSRKRYNRSNGY